MDIAQLAIPGAYVVRPRVFPDERGEFAELYRFDHLAAIVGHPLNLAQVNTSRSRRGSVRGLHYADVPPSQAKYVSCAYGSILDVVVDIRVGSPTFGESDALILDAENRTSVYLSEGLGHAFMALTDGAVVNYLCSTTYNPASERGINPADPALGIAWPVGVEPVLSAKDLAAPTLEQAHEAGLLPSYDDCQKLYEALSGAANGAA